MTLLQCSFLLVAAFTGAALAVISWRRRQVPCGRAFFFMMLGAAFWAGGDVLTLVIDAPSFRLVAAGVVHAAIGVVMVAWVALALEYTGYGRWLTGRVLACLLAIPAATVVGVLTNDVHHWFWTYLLIDGKRTREMQAGFHVFEIYCTALMIAGAAFLLLSLLTASPLHRRQTGLLLGAGVLPWFADLAQRLGLIPSGDLSPVPYCFTVSGPLLAWGVLRYRLLEIVPVARHHVLREMEDGVLVIDPNQLLLDLNPAAARLLEVDERTALGQPVSAILKGTPALVRWIAEPDPASSFEFHCPGRNGKCLIEAHRTLVEDSGSEASAMLVFLRDVSVDRRQEAERDKLVAELRDTVANVRSLSGLLPICSGCRKVHGRDGSWQSIEQFLELHSTAALTHSICPDCLKRLYPDLDL
jgi:PAS domain-containing protein